MENVVMQCDSATVCNIYKLLYSLYKLDWMCSHNITKQQEIDTLFTFFDYVEESEVSMDYANFEDFLMNYGFSGEIYCCFDEFCDNEFKDSDYMLYLIGDRPTIRTLYLKELKAFDVASVVE